VKSLQQCARAAECFAESAYIDFAGASRQRSRVCIHRHIGARTARTSRPDSSLSHCLTRRRRALFAVRRIFQDALQKLIKTHSAQTARRRSQGARSITLGPAAGRTLSEQAREAMWVEDEGGDVVPVWSGVVRGIRGRLRWASRRKTITPAPILLQSYFDSVFQLAQIDVALW